MYNLLNNIENTCHKLAGKMVWSNALGLARTLLATGTILTLIFNSNIILFGGQLNSRNLITFKWSFFQYTFFYLFASHLIIGKILAIAILCVVASGWRPRFTCLLHWFIAFSFNISCVVPDGGDQITNVLTLLIIPICLFDERKWHWDKPFYGRSSYTKLVAYSAYWVIRIQVAVVYLDAATEKFKVEEWTNGTALWYIFNDPLMGCNDFFKPFIIPIIRNAFLVTLFTWSSMVFELLLFLGLTLNKNYRKRLLLAGIGFHFFIMLIHGLISFFCAMTAALILYLYPWEQQISFWLSKPSTNLRKINAGRKLHTPLQKQQIEL